MEGKAATALRVTPFSPAPWLPGPHAQTIAGRLLRRPRPLPLRRERLELPDGDFVDLDFTTAPAPDHAPIVLLLHGLEGSARRGYALNTYHELGRHGIRAVGLNFRSCSGEPNRTARAYHSGETGDIAGVLRFLVARYPHARRGAIGFSLGGNALLKLLGEEPDSATTMLAAAVAISVPYDLAAGADLLEQSRIGRFYTWQFIRSLGAKVEARAALLADHCDVDRIRAARTFREFDDAATAPLHGFRDAADYYARCSSSGFIEHIRVPTLLLHSADDPFQPAQAFPHAAAARNPNIEAVLTQRGGHVGFVEGPPWAPRFWAEREAARFLARQLLRD